MRYRNLLPQDAIDFVKRVRNQLRFRACDIRSSRIAPDVKLGKKVTIFEDVELNAGVAVGDHTYINRGTIVGSGSIGKFCSIGYSCQIGMPEHPTRALSTAPAIYGRVNIVGATLVWNDYGCPPRIGNDVWIGSNAIILQGVAVGDGAVIGAAAVVTHDVGPYEIVCGAPARPIRRRFDSATIDFLTRSAWWDLPADAVAEFNARFLEFHQPVVTSQ